LSAEGDPGYDFAVWGILIAGDYRVVCPASV